jgi:hypothetical protein
MVFNSSIIITITALIILSWKIVLNKLILQIDRTRKSYGTCKYNFGGDNQNCNPSLECINNSFLTIYL